jgi:hypothetical protein
VLDEQGNPVSHDVAHFDMHKPLEDRVNKLEQTTQAVPANSSPAGGWLDRVSHNLDALLEDEDAPQSASPAPPDNGQRS